MFVSETTINSEGKSAEMAFADASLRVYKVLNEVG
jgi:hypothetical protein